MQRIYMELMMAAVAQARKQNGVCFRNDTPGLTWAKYFVTHEGLTLFSN